MSDWISAERLSELIGLIYDCAIDPQRWPVAMEAIRVELDGANAALDLVEVSTATSLLHLTTNIPPYYAERARDYPEDAVENWGGMATLAKLPLDRPAVLTETAPSVERIWASKIYTEWSVPQGINDMLAIWLALDGTTMGALTFARFERSGPFGQREKTIAALLMPHLQRVAAINRLLDIAALERSTFAALFDTLTVPVLLVDADLRLVHVNVSARKMLDSGRSLREREGMLLAGDAGTQQALVAAMTQLTDDRASLDRQGIGIPLKLADGAVGALHVLPLVPNSLPGRADAVAAVFVARSLNPLVAPTRIFAALFGLTPSESRVFDHIAAGRSVAQTAAALRVKDSTVRTHLLRVYDKTGVRRQAELVRMAASLTAPFEATS